MKERPILFSAPMVRALLAGTKTQTRRVMKVQPPDATYMLSRCMSTTGPKKDEGRLHWLKSEDYRVIDGSQPYFDCPYGQPGDRLWVRETWMDLLGTGIERKTGDYGRFAYAADTPPGSYGDQCRKDYGLKWRPSIHMLRIASRITLEVTGVRVERLNDISVSDCCNEGAPLDKTHAVETWYRELWEQINGPGSWAANPWVWVVEFKRLTAQAKGE